MFPDREGPASHQIADEQDVHEVIQLLRLNYDRFTTKEVASTSNEAAV